MTVDAATWNNNSALYVSVGGSGTLQIQNGGVVSSSAGYISYSSNNMGGYAGSGVGLVTVSGTGSQWTSGNLTIGGSGQGGMLNISNGGTVSSANTYIGYQTGSSSNPPAMGTVTVTGANSTWTNSGNVTIGYSGGTGTVNLVGGGVASSNKTTVASYGCGGTLNFDGGTLKAYSSAANAAWLAPASGGTGSVYIKEGGATFDTTGSTASLGISIALQHGGANPTDGGVTKIGNGTLTLDRRQHLHRRDQRQRRHAGLWGGRRHPRPRRREHQRRHLEPTAPTAAR